MALLLRLSALAIDGSAGAIMVDDNEVRKNPPPIKSASKKILLALLVDMVSYLKSSF